MIACLLLPAKPYAARKHDVEDVVVTPPATPHESFNSTTLVMLIGPSRTGELLEIGVSRAEGIDFIIHAIPARAKFIR